MRVLTSVVLFAILFNAASAAEREWSVYHPGNGACTVKFPVNPEYQTQTVDTVAVHVYIAKDFNHSPPIIYTVAFADYGKEKLAEKDAAKKILDSDRDSFIKAIGGKSVSEKAIAKDGFPGRETIISGEDGLARHVLHQFLVGNRIFQVAVCTPKEKAEEPDVLKFFDSFQLPK